MNTLTLQPAERPGEDLGGGARRTARHYQDLVVDGVSIGHAIRAVQDCISRVGWGPREYQEDALGALLLEREPDLPGGRVALYVCPECGDLACGAITAIIERQDDAVTWRDFSYESEIDPPLTLEPLKKLGPFTFAWKQYSTVLRSAAAETAADAATPTTRWWHRRR